MGGVFRRDLGKKGMDKYQNLEGHKAKAAFRQKWASSKVKARSILLYVSHGWGLQGSGICPCPVVRAMLYVLVLWLLNCVELKAKGCHEEARAAQDTRA